MQASTFVGIVGAAVGVLGFLFGVYKHFSTRKIAKLTYIVSQISDFGVPPSFLQGMDRAPVAISLTSRGNKGTENIIGRIRARNLIEECKVEPASTRVSRNGKEITFELEQLNPSQQIHLSLRCVGDPSVDQIEEFLLSHSEGVAIDERRIRSFTTNFMGIELEYEFDKLGESKMRLKRIGPITIRD